MPPPPILLPVETCGAGPAIAVSLDGPPAPLVFAVLEKRNAPCRALRFAAAWGVGPDGWRRGDDWVGGDIHHYDEVVVLYGGEETRLLGTCLQHGGKETLRRTDFDRSFSQKPQESLARGFKGGGVGKIEPLRVKPFARVFEVLRNKRPSDGAPKGFGQFAGHARRPVTTRPDPFPRLLVPAAVTLADDQGLRVGKPAEQFGELLYVTGAEARRTADADNPHRLERGRVAEPLDYRYDAGEVGPAAVEQAVVPALKARLDPPQVAQRDADDAPPAIPHRESEEEAISPHPGNRIRPLLVQPHPQGTQARLGQAKCRRQLGQGALDIGRADADVGPLPEADARPLTPVWGGRRGRRRGSRLRIYRPGWGAGIGVAGRGVAGRGSGRLAGRCWPPYSGISTST